MNFNQLSDNLIPYPDLPEGYSKWEWRGNGWINLSETVYAWRSNQSGWKMGSSKNIYGANGIFYIEAVREFSVFSKEFIRNGKFENLAFVIGK